MLNTITNHYTTTSHWTIDTLKEYFDRIIEENNINQKNSLDMNVTALRDHIISQKESVKIALEAAEKATNKAEMAQKDHNLHANEFRAALSDSTKLNLTRIEADNQFSSVRQEISQQGLTFKVSFDQQEKQIIELQKIASRDAGSSETKEKARSQANWLIGLVIATAVSILLATLSIGYQFIAKH